jgi:P27 family predicted phage terminase small subunit
MGGFGSGRPGMSVEQHKLHGTYRKDRHGKPSKVVPTDATAFPPPKWLTKEARSFWRQNAPELCRLGLLDGLSQTMFMALCETWSHWRALQAILDKEGLVVDAPRGGKRAHPAAALALKTSGQLTEQMDRFGMTPVGRRKLRIEHLFQVVDKPATVSRRDRFFADGRSSVKEILGFDPNDKSRFIAGGDSA